MCKYEKNTKDNARKINKYRKNSEKNQQIWQQFI